MSVKSSISLTASQDAFARTLVAEGRYASLSAVLQHGLEMLRVETEAKRAETEALRELLEQRRRGPFLDEEESQAHLHALLARKKAALGL